MSLLSATFILLTMVVLAPSLALAKTVVMFPAPLGSYFIYHSNIGQALADLGHDVWICVPHYLINKGLIKSKDLNILIYGEKLGHFEQNFFEKIQFVDAFWEDRSIFINVMQTFPDAIQLFKNVTETVLSDNKFVDKIHDLNPDLFILDGFMFLRNLLVLPYKLDLPFAMIGTLHEMVFTRVPFSPAVEPFVPTDFTNKMTFLQRVQNVFITLGFSLFDSIVDYDVVTRFAPEKPYKSILDISLTAQIYIAELDYILDYPRPTLPNTKLIGGSSASEAKPLLGELNEFVENSTRGVVVVSFGSMDVKIPDAILLKMVQAFQLLDLSVVWKVNLNVADPRNIKISRWLPQNDLLGHAKTRVFVSHCGKNGQYEALYHAVPIVCLPIFFDQHYNTNRIIIKGFGLGGDLRKITSQEFADLINEVAYNPKYKTNIRKGSELFKELYKVPNKEAAYWFDHVIKYGGDYMRSSGQEMPLYQFLLLDVMAFLIGFLFGVFLLICVVIKLLFKCICKTNQTKSKGD
ncbi:unnamed protein product [Lymnaea stagnalis]|uniref:UDP-glucuronosyltransferase n=1 Tax=Lymnaea stagnalis TaxID=6523 RepID=A0AAV2IFU5_LYMST